MEKWAGAVFPFRKFRSSRSPHSLGGCQCLSLGQDGSLARKVKPAALRLQCAVSLGRVGLQFFVDLPHACNGLLSISTGIGSLVGITFTQGKGRK
jgi:hypothetical protein